MSARVYVATTWTGLQQIVTADGIGPAPFFGHAVTRALRAAWPDGEDEELEYAATSAAAAFISTMSRRGPVSPSRMARMIRAFSSRSPPISSPMAARSSPKSSGRTV